MGASTARWTPLHRALDAKPNAAYLMHSDGSVAFRTLWSNDDAVLRDGLGAVVEGRTAGERQPHLVPMIKGMGAMDEVLGLAGQQARRDVRREVPPMYLMARLASLFRPLPPLGRGIAAMLASLLGMLGLVAGGAPGPRAAAVALKPSSAAVGPLRESAVGQAVRAPRCGSRA